MNIYQTVTQKILDELSKGVVPWKKQWVNGLPASLTTSKKYRGINIVLLGLRDHTSRYWVTYKSAMQQKGNVLKGSKGSPIVFWKWRTEAEIEKLKAEGKNVAPCMPFLYTVFNLEQTEGLHPPEDDLQCEKKDKIEAAELVFKNYKNAPKINNAQFLSPSYVPSEDLIQMPHMTQFNSVNHYYSTLFHELIHSTGHEGRLKREIGYINKKDSYSFEELVAELGSAFLCAHTGIDNESTLEDQSSYIKNWQSFLADDSSAFMRACTEAQKAVDYILGVEFSDSQVTE